MNSIHKLKSFLVLLLFTISTIAFGQSSKFKVVLDAGHGGKDWGASHHGFVEKRIALNVVLELGKILEKSSNIEVIYTRKTDVFIELTERAHIANRVGANLFISIHCNGNANYAAYGTETFVMGMSRSAMNLEVAKKENQVIELEADYKLKYKGFDPNSPETTLGLNLLKEQYLDQSISIAGKIQEGFRTGLKRKSRGVKQAPIWVLDATVMPGVLVELGFLSNKEEGAYINSEKGQDELARSIANAIFSYKKEYFGSGENEQVAEKYVPKSEPEEKEVVTKEADVKKEEPKETAKTDAQGVVFKVQISASGKKLDLTPANFKGLSDLSVATDNGTLFKYMYGNTSDYSVAKQNLAEAKAKGFDSAYIIAFKDGKKVNLQDVIKN
ncbi:N-acetylmuramoyl-L-alanine amidase [Flavobacterium arsenatis]|uniref:N-acetylmuramoyl-L-alanine amidase n=1 Tax=Flavobacterium arsenatis TaxID=1484332 RepID=A0ABU1TMF2_9FLAO|nr:N-acetylmuramoyl-L-alanine amidase [Flavobacterium arsenatis]MDR6967142.1 N-acetylmuramoyl-L-alanine amidase [Flavobacterium arsenatis]